MTRPTVEQLIAHFQLETLPVEGGIFRQMYRSRTILRANALPGDYASDKPAGTAIVFLYTPDEDSFSALHKLPTDEVYHFYLGDPVRLLLLHEDGRSERITLGQDVLSGQHVQFTIPAGTWQGSLMIPGGDFALIGMTMAPGYTSSDYLGGDRVDLIEQYPHEADLITRLTRPEKPLRMPDGY
jgi:predicted cupin superfamily sugar epimerase